MKAPFMNENWFQNLRAIVTKRDGLQLDIRFLNQTESVLNRVLVDAVISKFIAHFI
jgi:hypothetical protein